MSQQTTPGATKYIFTVASLKSLLGLFDEAHLELIIYIKAIWVIDQVGLQVGLRALNDRVRMNFMCEKPTKAII